MTDTDNRNDNQSEDWLNKIKKQKNGAEEDQQDSSAADGNKEEAEEEPVHDSTKNDDNAEREIEITQDKIPEDDVAEDLRIDAPLSHEQANKDEHGQSEKAPTLSRHGVSDEQVIKILDVLPENIYAHFLIIDTDFSSGVVCNQPKYILINQCRTLIGRYAKAHVYLDDPQSVKIKHAKVIFEEENGEKAFAIYPIDEATVFVNGNKLLGDRVVLRSGDTIEIGRIKLVFFYCPMERTSL